MFRLFLFCFSVMCFYVLIETWVLELLSSGAQKLVFLSYQVLAYIAPFLFRVLENCFAANRGIRSWAMAAASEITAAQFALVCLLIVYLL